MRTLVPPSRAARVLANLHIIPIFLFTLIAFVVSINDSPAFWVGVFLVLAAVHLFFAVRIARLGVDVDGDELVVRNIYMTHRVIRARVASIGVGELPHLPGKRALYLDLGNEAQVFLFGTSTGKRSWRSGRPLMTPTEQAAARDVLVAAINCAH